MSSNRYTQCDSAEGSTGMNTIEPFVCGGNAAVCQVTLTTCYVQKNFRQQSTVFKQPNNPKQSFHCPM